jgi:hypothetical protein
VTGGGLRPEELLPANLNSPFFQREMNAGGWRFPDGCFRSCSKFIVSMKTLPRQKCAAGTGAVNARPKFARGASGQLRQTNQNQIKQRRKINRCER